MSKYGEYRYLAYTYGHSGWSGRLRELLFMNSTIFMERSECNEFYFDALRPGVDYVPVAEDLSDLQTKVETSARDIPAARAMASSWIANGAPLMSMGCILDYIDGLLRKYAEYQRYAPEEHLEWPVHSVNSTAAYFLESTPPSLDTCRPYF